MYDERNVWYRPNRFKSTVGSTIDSKIFLCDNISGYIQYKSLSIEKYLKFFLPKEYFIHNGKCDFPLIMVNDYYITFPCDKVVCKKLIQDSEDAPFGRGEQTLVDKKVRNSFQVNKTINFISKNPIGENSSLKNPMLEEILTRLW
jgi:hypothetical protein